MRRQHTLIPLAILTASVAWCQSGASATDIGVLKVQGNVWMVVTPAGNIAAQIGNDGLVVVNTAEEALAPAIAAALKKLDVSGSDKAVQWIINTDAAPNHIGGNVALPVATGLPRQRQPRIIAQANVLNLLGGPQRVELKVPEALWPNDEYNTPTKDFAFNGEAVMITHVPRALSDGDSIVHFRRSDVLAVGDIFTPGLYPVIRVDRGGTIQGFLDALNQVLRITVPLKYQEGGTYVIPGRGRLCDEADVVEYRNMVTIVRDRVLDAVKKNRTLEQTLAAKLTRDYDVQYNPKAADAFVEAIYKTVKK
jgi:cyclase